MGRASGCSLGWSLSAAPALEGLPSLPLLPGEAHLSLYLFVHCSPIGLLGTCDAWYQAVPCPCELHPCQSSG